MNINPREIAKKVHTLLSEDAATLAVAWHLGRLKLDDLRTLPAGTVAVGDGELTAASIPSGAQARFDIVVTMRYRAHGDVGEAGVSAAEDERDKGFNDVLTMLWAHRKLDLTRVMMHTIAWTLDSNADAQPPYAEATVTITVVVRDP